MPITPSCYSRDGRHGVAAANLATFRRMAGIVASTIAFFIASYFIKRYFDGTDIPKGMTRNITIFTLALATAYAVGWAVDHIA
jgi:hypothetical protein